MHNERLVHAEQAQGPGYNRLRADQAQAAAAAFQSAVGHH
jgi:hypothetical protein